MYEENHPQFFTATINEWHHLLRNDAVKDIIIGSLRFLVNAKRVNVYGFVIMSNHLHLIWRIKSPHLQKKCSAGFFKIYRSANQILFKASRRIFIGNMQSKSS